LIRGLVVLLPILPSLGLLYLLLKKIEWEETRRQRRNPLTQNLLRSPGETIRMQLKENLLNLMSWVVLVLIAGPMLGTVLFGNWALSGKLSLPDVGLVVVGFGFCVAVAWKRIQKYMLASLWLQIGLDAEEAIGQELNYLMPRGFSVFHDIPGEGFNIDHVVVGPPGLFVVETKGRSKPMDKSRVFFDGKVLRFPGWEESKPVDQVLMTARWCEKWIRASTGHDIVATPVIAIPGWYIERTTGDTTVLTVNGQNMASAFEKFGRQPLSPERVLQVSFQLEQRCRNVEPRAYRDSASRSVAARD